MSEYCMMPDGIFKKKPKHIRAKELLEDSTLVKSLCQEARERILLELTTTAAMLAAHRPKDDSEPSEAASSANVRPRPCARESQVPSQADVNERAGGKGLSLASELRMLRMPEVLSRTGLSRITLWRSQKAGTFPKGIKIGRQAVGWLASDIDQWITSR